MLDGFFSPSSQKDANKSSADTKPTKESQPFVLDFYL